MIKNAEVLKSPYSCYINLTSKCNLRCRHCYGNYADEDPNTLSWQQWEKIVEDLNNYEVFLVNLSGGEITQSKYFKPFVELLSKKGIHFILTTNGVFNQEIRDFILKNQEFLVGIKISLDGPDEDSHEFIRKSIFPKGEVFKTTMENIKFFSDSKIPLTITTVLHKGNIYKMQEFASLIKKINPISWFISPIIPEGRGKINKNIHLDESYFDLNFWNNLYENNKKEKINVKLIDMPYTKEDKLPFYECGATLNFCEIHSDGTVSPCTLSRYLIPSSEMKFENIKDKSLKEIWEGKIFYEFRKQMKSGCEGCKSKIKCNKCVAQSFKYFKNGHSPTPFCVKQGEKLGLKDNSSYKEILKKEFNLIIK